MKNKKTLAYDYFDKSNIIEDYIGMYKNIIPTSRNEKRRDRQE